MSDNTQLNAGSGGDLYRAEDVGGGVKIAVAKLHNGGDGVDGGSITPLNPLDVQTPKSATGTQASVSGTTSDTTILEANASRKGALFFNRSTATLYLLFANAVSSSSVCSVEVAPGGFYELTIPYTGIVKGIWSAANGAVRVTEFT